MPSKNSLWCLEDFSSFFKDMASGATAGLFGRLVCHPIDTCKARHFSFYIH